MKLFIFEDQSMQQTNRALTKEDLKAIDEGILTVIEFANGRYYEYDGSGTSEVLPIKD